ncbi:MAG: RDD family protein [bacterium]
MFTTAYPDPTAQAQFYDNVLVKRAMAWIFDTVLIAFLMMLIIPLTGFLALFFLGGLYVVISFIYRWMGMSRHSATLGMRMAGVEFRDSEGYPLNAAAGFAHTLFYALSVAFVLPQILSVLMMIFSRRGQGLSDVLLGVVLVNRRALY